MISLWIDFTKVFEIRILFVYFYRQFWQINEQRKTSMKAISKKICTFWWVAGGIITRPTESKSNLIEVFFSQTNAPLNKFNLIWQTLKKACSRPILFALTISRAIVAWNNLTTLGFLHFINSAPILARNISPFDC